MTVTVLVVDDSRFFLRRLCDLLNAHPQIKVIGTAENGNEAVEKALSLNPDVITMDYEMPVMDGITAVSRITEKKKIPILMFSSLTHEGARVTLDALEAGAVDYLPKNFDEISRNSRSLQKILHERILNIAGSHPRIQPQVKAPQAAPASPVLRKPPAVEPAPPSQRVRRVKLVAIGTSTGGPVALHEVLSGLPPNFPVPILVIQHMPAAFTKPFADRLNRTCSIKVLEAENRQRLERGTVYIAPGGMQMIIDSDDKAMLRIMEGDERLNYKPSVDVTFGSAAKAYGPQVLGIVLTGMGADGREGSRLLKSKGSRIWTQDKDSCVIYGMPMAVDKAKLSDESVELNKISKRLVEEVK